jgi:glycosyltransferase involved in cell wall biosynthesis
MRGGEKCLEALCELYPDAVIHTLFHRKGKLSPGIARHEIRTSPVQELPGVFEHYRYYLPFFPAAIETFDMRGYDLIVSTSHCVAKGIRRVKPGAHICYCFTPMRYAWGFFDEYFGNKSGVARAAIRFFMARLREWDRRTSDRVDRFIAISQHVRERILRYYGRDAEVIYPPADTVFYTPSPETAREDFYLIVSALVPYKRVDLAVRALGKLGRRLIVIGDGPELATLKRLARPGTTFLGWQSDESIRDHYRRARALVFPGEEDFGIVPVEAQACGLPVVAYGRGGALETVLRRETGLFFAELTEESLCGTIEEFERTKFLPELARLNAERFSRDRFKKEIRAAIDRALPVETLK